MIKFVFYFLSFISILSGTFLITNKNPVYSVLNLVLLFLCGSILLVLLGLDFLPFVLVVVYVGAVAVLFLFVVIMLDIKLASKTKRFKEIYLLFVGCLSFFFILGFLTKPYNSKLNIFENKNANFSNMDFYSPDFYNIDDFSSLSLVGQVLYTEYILHFVIGGLVLLLAIVGAIVLTSRVHKVKFNRIKNMILSLVGILTFYLFVFTGGLPNPIKRIMEYNFILNAYLDAPLPGQIGFQDAATPNIVGIISFHNHLIFVLVGIGAFVFSLLYGILKNFKNDKKNAFTIFQPKFSGESPSRQFTRIIWTILPEFIRQWFDHEYSFYVVMGVFYLLILWVGYYIYYDMEDSPGYKKIIKKVDDYLHEQIKLAEKKASIKKCLEKKHRLKNKNK